MSIDQQTDATVPATRVAARDIPKLRISLFVGFSGLKLTRLSRAFDEFGDVVQLTAEVPLRLYCFRHPEHIKDIYSQKATALTKPPKWLARADWLMGNSTFNDLGGAEWKRKRQFVDPVFARKDVAQYDWLVAEVVQNMLSRWNSHPKKGPTIDVYREMRRLVVDFSSRLLFGDSLGNRLDELADATYFAEHVFAVQIPQWIPTPRNLRFRRIGRDLKQMFDEMIDAQRTQSKKASDIMARLLGGKDEAIGRTWTHEEVRSECFSVYFGAHAMSNPLTWTLYLLSRHPLALRKLQHELAEVLGGETPTAADLPRLKYMEMVFNESMRLYPPFWGSLRFAKESVEIGGYRFPRRSTFLPVRYFGHRHPDYWNNPKGSIPSDSLL